MADGSARVLRRDQHDAVVGWRYWQLTPEGRLRSVSHRRFVWPPDEPMRASCVIGKHRRPAPDCGCGLYGAADLASLRRHDLCLSADPVVVGEVALWGEIVAADGDFRGELARPRSLWLVPETVADEDRSEALAALEDFAVPVGVMRMDRAVSGVTATLIANEAMSRSVR